MGTLDRSPMVLTTLALAMEHIGRTISDDGHTVIVPVNVDVALQMRRSMTAASAVRSLQGSVLTVDGMPLVWVLRLRGEPIERVTGADLAAWIAREAGDRKWRVALFGGRPDRLVYARERLLRRGCGSVWGYAPTPDEVAETPPWIIDAINAFAPHVLLVGLGFPKQEQWIASWQGALTSVPVILSCGAAVDFLGGLPRSPQWLQVVGGEWAFRLAREPRRLLTRYARDAVGLPRIAVRLSRRGVAGLLG